MLVNHIFGIVLRRKVNIVGGAGGRFLFFTGHVVSSERQRLIQSQVIICVCKLQLFSGENMIQGPCCLGSWTVTT